VLSLEIGLLINDSTISVGGCLNCGWMIMHVVLEGFKFNDSTTSVGNSDSHPLISIYKYLGIIFMN